MLVSISYNGCRKLMQGMKIKNKVGYCYSLLYLSYICVRGPYGLCQLYERGNSPSKGYHMLYFIIQ